MCIYNKADLIAYREAINGGELTLTAILMDNIELNGEMWAPIGTSKSMCYAGVFEGNSYMITDLTIDSENSDYQGLFGYIDEGEVYNLTIKNPQIEGYNYIGAICGYLNSGSIVGCGVESGSISGNKWVGGVVGANSYSFITNCYNKSVITGADSSTGGIVGSTNNCTISACYNAGNVSTFGNSVGGVVGYNGYSTITNCYNTGEIRCDYGGTYSYIGGLIGYNYYSSLHASCYNVGVVSSLSTSGGGVVGTSIGSISSTLYYNNEIFTASTNYGSGVTTSTMKTAEFVVALNNSQIPEPWMGDYDGGQSINSGYPILSWQTVE